MDRLYRVAHGQRCALRRRARTDDAHDVELTGGEHLRRLSRGRADAPAGSRPRGAGAGSTVEDRLRRPELQDHAAEMSKALPAEPLLFLKPSTAVLDPGATDSAAARRRTSRSRGRAGRRDRPAGAPRAARAAWDYVLGITCVNDVTARDMQNKEIAVHARQGLRYVRADRPVHRGRSRRRAARRRRLGQRRTAAVVVDRRS